MGDSTREESFIDFLGGPVLLWLVFSALLGSLAWWYSRSILVAEMVAGGGAFLLLLYSFWLKVRLDSRWLVEIQAFLVKSGALPENHRMKRFFLPWQVESHRTLYLSSSLDSMRGFEKKFHEARHALDRFMGTKASQFAAKYASRSEWGGEAALMYILFADVRGFTRMAEQLKPTETVQFLNRFFSAMEEAVRESGGEVNKYMGDALLAFFPRPAEDEGPAVKRILLGALKMKDRFLEIDAKYKNDYSVTPDVGMGVGMASGPVIFGNVGSMNRMEFTLVGDTVNLASRLCAIAEPGQILVSEEVAKAAEGMFRMEALGAVRLKGKFEAVTPYVVLGERLQPGLA